MSTEIINHIKKYISIHADDEAIILGFFKENNFNKKENLITLNNTCNSHYFIRKGCVRMFFVNEKGVEQTIQFAIENWWITDYLAFENRTKTSFTIQAIENTEVLEIDYKNQEELLKKFPELERYFRLIFQRAYSASILRTKYLFDFSREEFYHHFKTNFPEFVTRIPQHILASFLNMTPEYLSEIKKREKS